MDDLSALKIDRNPAPKRPGSRRATNPWFVRTVGLIVLAGVAWVFYRPVLDFLDRFRLPHVRVTRVVESHPALVGAVSGTAANGYIVAARRAALSADTPGRIVELHVTEGSVVKKGDVVARLFYAEVAANFERTKANTVAAKADVARATAAVQASRADEQRRLKGEQIARAQTDEAHANLRLAQARFGRTQDLFNRKIASQDDVDASQAELDAAKARLATAEARKQAAVAESRDGKHKVSVSEANVKVAEAQHAVAISVEKQAKATLDKTYVRAPFNGIVVLKDAEVGEVVSPTSLGGNSARGSVCTMVDFASLEVQADVPETSIASVKLGAAANIYLDAYPGRTYPGRVSRIWPTASRQKASIEVRVVFEKRDKDLRPDMGVRVVFLSDGKAATDAVGTAQILIPEDTLVEIQGQTGVFVLERNTVRFQTVEIGKRKAGKVEVISGLKIDQQIVTKPSSDLDDGSRVYLFDTK
ncbi:MAG: efflux RND transporter periplasmic adaptor subunit [Planctomycetota bacterium]|nr:efflux RND transporter periplasmic adaptor subunit [Planctomycetota bacterium]